jgi:predicted AAA+ superfamily ATPase
MKKDRLKEIVLDGRDRLSEKRFVPRDLAIDHRFIEETGKIAAVVGPRRAGKSTFLAQIARELSSPAEAIVFVDFSELPLRAFAPADFELLYVAQRELEPHRTPVFLLDEIQEVTGFESSLIYLTGKGARVYLTGSSTQIAVGDLASTLRGKVLPYRLHPLSFPEFLRFRGAEGLDPRKTEDAALLYSLLDVYELWGGFPEVVLADRDDTRRNLIDSYVDVMLLRDVVEKHAVKNLRLARRLLARLLSAYTREISVSRWHNELRSMGMSVARDTVYDYVSYFERSLFFLFSENVFAGATARRKVYLADTGLVAHTRPTTPDTDKRFENHMFLLAFRQGERPGYARGDQGELDLVFRDRAVQVCVSLSSENELRELEPLRRFRSRGGSILLVVRDTRELDTRLLGDIPVADIRDVLRAPELLTRSEP